MSVEIEWAAVQALDQSPALSVWSRYVNATGQGGEVRHVIPAADLDGFNPKLSIWQLIEVACDPALQAQIRLGQAHARVQAAMAKRQRKQAARIVRPTLDDAVAFMAGADVERGGMDAEEFLDGLAKLRAVSDGY